MNNNFYVVEQVPYDMLGDIQYEQKNKWDRPWYCHMRGYEYIPVFGSIGTKEEAESVCRKMNTDGKVRYERD